MSTQVSAVPGQSLGRQIVPLQIFTNPQTARYAPAWYFFDGSNARDPDNTPASLLRAGLIAGKATSTTGDVVAPTTGSYANSIVGLTTQTVAGGQTTLYATVQAAKEVVRRFGATGTFNLTGEQAAGQTARTSQVTYSNVNTTTGAITITALDVAPVPGTNQIDALVFVDNTGVGTFTLTVEGTTTGAITYSATAATLVANINTALNTTFGASQIVASGATLAAVLLTFSGNNFSQRVVGPVTSQTVVNAGGTTYTINGQGAVGVPQLAPINTLGTIAYTVAPVNGINSIPFVDSTGTGTFTITYEGVTTAAITYNATYTTLKTNINNALNTALGLDAVVCSGASLAALVLTATGPAYAGRPIGAVTATILAASTGYTINGVGTIGTASVCAVTTAGVAGVPWQGYSGNFVAGSLIQPTDGSQTPLTIFDTEFGTDVLDTSANPINEPMHRYVIGGDLFSANIINLTTCSAGAQAWIKTALRANGGTFTFDNDR